MTHPENWCQLCTQFHNDQSTVLHRHDQFTAAFDPDHRTALFRSFSQLRFDQPFFYGRFDDLTWLVIFDRAAGIRLTHSPSGGGYNSALRSNNPAWDFQYLIREPVVNQRYGFPVRTLLLPPLQPRPPAATGPKLVGPAHRHSTIKNTLRRIRSVSEEQPASGNSPAAVLVCLPVIASSRLCCPQSGPHCWTMQ